MSKYIKVLIGIGAFIAVIVISSLAYNSLKDKYAGKGNMISKESEKSIDSKDKGKKNNENEKIKAVDFTVVDKDNLEVTLKSIIDKGKPIVINFWASWCPPCKSEMPDFQKVYEELGTKVQFLMINVTDGSRETKTTASNYIKSKGYTFPVYYDINDSAAYAYYVSAMPTTFFINKKGEIVTAAQGAINEETLRKGIEKTTENS